MLDLRTKYIFSPTVAALQVGDKVLLGNNIGNMCSIDMRTVSEEVIEAFSMFSKGITYGDILEFLKEPHRSDFNAAIEELHRRGHIEAIGAKDIAIAEFGKSGIDYTRFDRQINLFKQTGGSYEKALEVQSKLSRAKITIVGLGGCGSYVFYTLAAMGVGSIRAIEFDKVERSNLSRQIMYTHADIGRRKAEVAAEKGKLISPTTEFQFIDRQLLTVADCKAAYDDVDLVICAADQPRPDFYEVMNEATFKYGVPTLFVGSVTTNALVGPLLAPGRTRCRNCLQGLHKTPLKESHAFVQNILASYVTTLIDPYNAAAGSIAALEAVKFLTGFQECRVVGRTMHLNLDDYSLVPDPPVWSGACKVCN